VNIYLYLLGKYGPEKLKRNHIKYTIDVQDNVRYNMYRITHALEVADMSIINATTARNNFFKVMEEAIDTHEPVFVTGKNGNVVIVSEEDWRSIQETLYLCSIPGMKEKIVKGINTPLEECVEDND